MRDYVVAVSTCTMLLLLWTPANRAQNSSTPSCYCDDNAIPCTNNTCTSDFSTRCLVDFNLDTGMTRRVCVLHGLTCFRNTEDRHRGQCCEGTGCNKCLTPPNLTYEQCLQVTFPSDCPPVNCSHLIETPTGNESTNQATDQILPGWGIFIIVFVLVILLLLVVLTIVCYFFVYVKRCRRSSPISKYETNSQIESVSFISESGISGVSSGGRSGGALILEPKTIAKEIKLIELIASGGFSQLWKGTRIGATVAVKIYKSIDDQSFERERCIYTRAFLNHESIAIYYGADLHTPPLFPTEFWLIMRYYEHGCLADHLIHNTLPQKKVFRILCSIADALEYLHHPFNSFFGGNHGGVAHRDIKTRNILLKDEFGSCVVADFGLSLGAEDLLPGSAPVKVQVGTKRYMAPEVLNNSVVTTEIQSFCVTDIYSYGLVMWEVLRRSEGEGEPSEYAVPYHNLLPSDPTIELVRKVVVEQRMRPQLEERWNINKVHFYQNIVLLMKECWSASPDGRPTVARIRLKLAENLKS
ncbi:bone morphogenetic protein receptor type-1B-like isoform X2 [Halichondria panicea]|uniref:bone morphogenetic protein receptor type-1B-like isoform X2 n=1 Tax=Halichondria panicea TaxID=6063 RepID=UPI00312B9C0A